MSVSMFKHFPPSAHIPIRARTLVCHRNDTPAVVFGSTFQIIFVTKRCTPVRLAPCTRPSGVSGLYLKESQQMDNTAKSWIYIP